MPACSVSPRIDAIDTYETTRFFAMVALFAAFGSSLVALVSFSSAGRRFVRTALSPISLPLAWLVALVMTFGSLTLSEGLHLRPCTLCWYQRIAAYPLSLLLLVALATRAGRSVRPYVVPLAAIGATVSVWHILVENFPGLESNSCDPTNPCSAKLVEHFGFVTIPTMALAGFAAVLTLSFYFPKERR